MFFFISIFYFLFLLLGVFVFLQRIVISKCFWKSTNTADFRTFFKMFWYLSFTEIFFSNVWEFGVLMFIEFVKLTKSRETFWSILDKDKDYWFLKNISSNYFDISHPFWKCANLKFWKNEWHVYKDFQIYLYFKIFQNHEICFQNTQYAIEHGTEFQII